MTTQRAVVIALILITLVAVFTTVVEKDNNDECFMLTFNTATVTGMKTIPCN